MSELCYTVHMIKTTKKTLNNRYTAHEAASSRKTACFIDIKTTGHFWRTSYITELGLLSFKNDSWQLTRFYCDDEPAEYELLSQLFDLIGDATTLVSFNGTSFTLPFLTKKLRAYKLENHFEVYEHVDFLRQYKVFEAILGLPSAKLSDFNQFFNLTEPDDLEILLAITSLDDYIRAFKEKPLRMKAHTEDNVFYTSYELSHPCLNALSYRDAVFHVHFEGFKLTAACALNHNQLRLYYTDYENYDFLTAEGYAVHKSVSSFVDKSHKEKATRETCYALIPADDALLGNERRLTQYLISILNYLSTGLSH